MMRYDLHSIAASGDERVSIGVSSPSCDEAAALLDALDAYLMSLYLPEHSHILGIEALEKPEVTFVMARAEGSVVGCGALLRHEREFVEIKRMFVRPDARGRRIGESILRSLEQVARDESFAWARLETGIHQPEALRLYERCGYRRIGPFGAYADNGTSVFYERSLRDGT